MLHISSESEDAGRVMGAAESAVRRLRAIHVDDVQAMSAVFAPVAVHTGALLIFDLGDLAGRSATRALEAVELAVGDFGLADALISIPKAAREPAWYQAGPAVVAYLRGPVTRPDGGTATGLLDASLAWLGTASGPRQLWISGAAVDVEPGELEKATRAVLGSQPLLWMWPEPPNRHRPIRCAAVSTVPGPYATWTTEVAGPDQLRDLLIGERERIRPLAVEVDWAAVGAAADLDEGRWTLPVIQDPRPRTRWSNASLLPGHGVPDAYWWQVLGPGHIDRLGGVPEQARQIAPDRWELTLGEPEQWLPGEQLASVVTAARRLLTPLLLPVELERSLRRGGD